MKKAKNSIIGSIVTLIWLIIVAALVVAFLKVNMIQTPAQFFTYFRVKSKELGACVRESTQAETLQCSFNLRVGNYLKPEQYPQFSKENGITLEELQRVFKLPDRPNNEETIPFLKRDNNIDTTAAGLKVLPATKLTKEESLGQLEKVNVVASYREYNYSRADWKHWLPVNKNRKCWNTREETLYQQSDKSTITFLDGNGNKSTYENACSIESAKWTDPYSGDQYDKPGYLDVDHIIPLALVNKSGGADWSPQQKAQYANDSDVLITTSAKQNRAKGAKTPSEWMPPNKSAHCDYAKVYVNVLSKYKLSVTDKDKTTLEKALGTCAV